jgi:hypothetical protein
VKVALLAPHAAFARTNRVERAANRRPVEPAPGVILDHRFGSGKLHEYFLGHVFRLGRIARDAVRNRGHTAVLLGEEALESCAGGLDRRCSHHTVITPPFLDL